MCFPHSLVYFERQMQLTLLPFPPSLVMQFLGGAINKGGGGRRLRRLRPRRAAAVLREVAVVVGVGGFFSSLQGHVVGRGGRGKMRVGFWDSTNIV